MKEEPFCFLFQNPVMKVILLKGLVTTVLEIPRAYPCSSTLIFSQKELHFKGKDNFRITKFGNGKVWMWRRQKTLLFPRLERILFNFRKKLFL